MEKQQTAQNPQASSREAGAMSFTTPLKQFPKISWKNSVPLVVASVLVVLAGIGTGWLLSGRVSGGSLFGGGEKAAPGAKMEAKEAGLADEATFRDSAEGVLKEGGIEGE